MARCGAKTRSGGTCKNHTLPGSRRCRMHGGKTPRGASLPQTTHGRYSQYLPDRLKDRYLAAEADNELLNLRSDMALVESRIADLLQRVDTGESGAIWKALRKTYSALTKAQRSGDTEATAASMDDLADLITRGWNDYAAWEEVQELVDQRRKLVETERKRLVDMQQMITSEQAVMLVTSVVEAVKRHVDDTETLHRISRDLDAVFAGSGRTDHR